MSALVSVVIPCYKDSATLGRAIASVLAQHYPSIEIIVVNDASPETAQIEACLVDYPQVRYVRNPHNVGLAAARNAGIAVAQGEYIALLDADDEYHPDKIIAQMAVMAPGRAVTCGVMHIYPDGSTRVPRQARSGSIRIVRDSTRLQYRNTLNGAGLMIARRTLTDVGMYDASLRSCEDFDLVLRLLSAGIEMYELQRPLYLYHFNPLGLSKNLRNISRWEFTVIRRHAERKGEAWRRSTQYAAVISAWLLRHLMRAEIAPDAELRRETMDNMTALEGFPLFRAALKAVAYLRLMKLATLMLHRP